MQKYRCDHCEAIVNEDDIEYVRESYESYYGVTHLPGRHYFSIMVCPECGAEDCLDEYEEEEEEEEEE